MYALWLAFVACFHLTQAHKSFSCPRFGNWTKASFDNGNFNVSWKYNQTTDTLHFLADVNTTGWVGFGFTFTPKNMVGYDVVVGGRTNAGVNYLDDFYTDGKSRPPLDANQTCILEQAAEENGITTLLFNRLRNTADPQDIQFNFATQVYLVWAYHDTEDAEDPKTFSKHTRRGHTKDPVQIMKMEDTTESPTMTMLPPSLGRQLGFSFIIITLATILSVFMK